MQLYNINDYNEKVNFIQAVKKGLGKKQGLYFLEKIPSFSDKEITILLQKNFLDRNYLILKKLIGDELKEKKIKKIIEKSFSFPIPLVKISKNIFSLELFHGPTLAFKDFGCRFMANIFSDIQNKNEKTIILTATSGDTGAAVAHAFYNMKNIHVVILYPKNKISLYQEKLFCTLGKNITSLSVNKDFDTCQKFVKKAFEDIELKNSINLNSANSINISRLLAQICYYFEAVSKLSKNFYKKIVVSVPCGNFGNITAGFLAKSLGLPLKRFIAATNVNDTVPRYLSTGIWDPKKTISSLSNAMDISIPNNWPRIKALFNKKKWDLKSLFSKSINDEITINAIKELKNLNYLCDPHSAIAYTVLKENLKNNEIGIFLSTAHPAKFHEIIEKILDIKLNIPKNLSKYSSLKSLSKEINNFSELRNILLNI